MAVSNLFWSAMRWQSPLQKQLSDILMKDLKNEATLGRGTFGTVMKFKNTNNDHEVYVGRKLPEDAALSDEATRNSVLESFAVLTQQLCSISHSNIVQMHGVFFCDHVSYLPVLVHEKAIDWTLECYLLVNRPEIDKVTILQHVASGLEYLHDQKPPIVHLNLTVKNVFVSHPESEKLPTAKIADTGVINLANAANSFPFCLPVVDYLPEEEKELKLNEKVDVLCYGVLVGHVVLQEPVIKTLPIFFGDNVSDSQMLHRYLEVHPIYPVMQHCLKKRRQDRITASGLVQELYPHVNKVLQWAEKIQKEARDWIESSSTLDIMITGKTGSGKTSLINGLIGKKVGEEGDTLERGTTHVEPLELALGDTVARIWDTPGLQDGTDMEDQYLDEMKRHCSDCNLYIYCVSMKQTRFEASEMKAIALLTKTFGKDFWGKVLFVLTFANACLYNVDSDEKTQFDDKIKMWYDKLAEQLTNSGVSQEVVKEIKIVPAGYHKPLKYQPNPWELPGIPHWFQNFWYECAGTMNEQGLPALVTANLHRLKARENITEEDLNCSVEEQPIPIQGGATASTAVAVAGSATGIRMQVGISAVLGIIIGSLTGIADSTTIGKTINTTFLDPLIITIYKLSKLKKS